jgi:glycosyltransferase involved in cell wall biosynthesis
MSLVSVIIPGFNAATSIGATIDSVLSQTLQNQIRIQADHFVSSEGDTQHP